MKRLILILAVFMLGFSACAAVELNAPVPTYDTGVDPSAWARIPAGEFLSGDKAAPALIDHDYEMMVTDVTVSQYAAYLTEALAQGSVKVDGDQIDGYYGGDTFHGVKHEERIDPGDYIYIPLNDPSLKLSFDGKIFTAKSGWENHPMTMVSWFGAKGYCAFYGWRLPTELEWEKAARGPSTGPDSARPFPWGDGIGRNNANYYASRDPFENMSTYGSRTTPVGFYNGKTYDGYATLDSASPYGLYDMAGNVWQWTADVYEGQHYRYLRGGSKDTYDYNLRVWTRNNATPKYYSPGVGFRCAR